jgi:hypothetical protein
MKCQFMIFRFDPEADEKPYYQKIHGGIRSHRQNPRLSQ